MNICQDCQKPITNIYAKRCKNCAAKIRESRKAVFITCKNCGNQFRIKPSQKNIIKFCSKECRKRSYQVPCANCGKLFVSNHSDKTKAYTCSIKCRGELKTKLHPKGNYICDNCGKHFKAYTSQKVHSNIFCSRQCHQEWWKGSNHTGYNSIDCTCKVCNTHFKRTKYKVEKFGGKYCSRECFSQSQVLPAINYYGPDWKSQKRKARKRDNYTCQICGIDQSKYPRALDVHHIIPFRKFGLKNYQQANQLSNLVSLCKHCHRKVEKGTLSLS